MACYENFNHFQITVNAGGKQVILDDSIKLKQITEEICDHYHDGRMLMLNYFVEPTLPGDTAVSFDSEVKNYNIDTERKEISSYNSDAVMQNSDSKAAQ